MERTDSIASHYFPGSSNGYWTFCTQVDKRLIKIFMETWRDEIQPLLHIEGIDRAALADINFVMQNIIDAMSRRGGNALGLAGKGPFLLYLCETYWMDREQSPHIWEALRATADRTKEEAERLGLYHSYIYLNYANPYQDVYTSYGAGAKAFLKSVSKKHDPERFFQRQRGAGWNLHGDLVSTTGVDPAHGVVLKGKF
ncbi:hypothetical protein ONS95_011665 [Cadophora gregata]|uniref:uncharacterized protein n=1 Tax=Cadophora gregata TaxID=51156 RepID=UPI0026DCF131|nr:uncharacterized protein ONS95_011665 [Cadophora gregata]KAK0120260.1 hypothetical protein ONS95_011665 [Cadophora gregata]KAK0121295.1 hypothetical protein ONS96_011469 [Cadophora gregata f. sp. sojae]